MSFIKFQFFFPDAALFYFSWPLRENSTTELRLLVPIYFRTTALPKPCTRHALLSPHREPGSFSGINSISFRTASPSPRCRCYNRSAARIFALRDRGLLSISTSDAVTGFLVSNRKCMSFAPSRIASFTILSSSEWKLITTNLPPGFSNRGAASINAFRSSNSRFTNIRRA